MGKTEMNVCIGGEAGQGLATIGQVLGKALVRKGYHLHVTQSYESRIRGGHNTFSLRTGTAPVAAPGEQVDLLIALDAPSLTLHTAGMAEGTLVLCDAAMPAPDVPHLQVPLAEMAKGTRRNTAMLGIAGCLLGLSEAELAGSLAHFLGKQPPAVIEENEAILAKATAWLATQQVKFTPLAPPSMPPNSNLMLHGNEAIALGALAAGLKFCSFYPMSPATTVPLAVAAAAKNMGVVVEQAEDEIAAINMAIGASYAGARAMTATSGGGFALMTEGVSLAGATETPIVIVIAMRPGPATGLPTRTEQGDLECVLYSGHGDFPRAILAPGSLQQCFDTATQAFTLAERHQSPVFILTDQYLADSYRSCPPFALTPPPPLADVLEQQHKGMHNNPAYERFTITESGVSPRLLPGMGKALVRCDSDEHTPDGQLTEDLTVRVAMQDKRMRKLAGLEQEALAPTFTGPQAADLLLVCWGSTHGAVEEAAERLRSNGHTIAVCHFSQVYPLRQQDFLPQFTAADRVVMVEGNHTGQLAALIRRETDFAMHDLVLRYDGLPMTAQYIVDALQTNGL